MTRSEVKNFLMKKFIDEYTGSEPVCFPNDDKFDKPTNAAWIDFRIQNNDSYQASLGIAPRRRFERMGFILFNVYIPPNTGTYDGDQICEEILNIFEGKRFGSIVCTTGTYQEIGINNEDFFQFYGTVYFYFDETK